MGNGKSRGTAASSNLQTRYWWSGPAESLILPAALIAVFVTLFVLGAFVDSAAYSLSSRGGGFSLLSILLVKVLTWTWSNVALLACLAALIGEIARTSSSNTPAKMKGALVRGFFVFLLALGGQLVLVGELKPESNRSTEQRQDDYIRIAGAVSVFAFAVGFKPKIFADLLREQTKDE